MDIETIFYFKKFDRIKFFDYNVVYRTTMSYIMLLNQEKI